MRLGVVCLLATVMAGQASAQRIERWNNNAFATSEGVMLRADGTTVDANTPHPRHNGPAAVSFRHYTHEPPKQARQHFSKAKKAAKAGNEQEALNHLAEAVRIDPDYFEAHTQLAIIDLQRERSAEALTHLEQALRIDGSSQLAQGLTAGALLALRRYPEAETAAKRALQLGHSIPLLEEVLRITTTMRSSVAQTALAIAPSP